MKIKSTQRLISIYILPLQYLVTCLPENLQRALTEWICPPLHSPSSWEISRCAHHYFSKCFSHSCLSALDRKLSVERPLYTENSMSIKKRIKKGWFNGLKKIAGHMRPPFGSASLELWLTAPVPQLCPFPASGGCFGSRFTREEKDYLWQNQLFVLHFAGQMYHSPLKISSRLSNYCYCAESQQPGM